MPPIMHLITRLITRLIMRLIMGLIMWYYCAVTGESKKIVFTSGATEKITSGGATSDFWSPHK
jgi:hypothetical protein